MAFELPILDFTFPTQVDLSSHQFGQVKLSSGLVVKAGNQEAALGFLQNKPDGSSSEAGAKVRLNGISKYLAASTVTNGDLIGSDANGKAVTATTAKYFNAYCLETVTYVDADLIGSCHIRFGLVT